MLHRPSALKLLNLLHLHLLPPRGHHWRRRTSIRKVSVAIVMRAIRYLERRGRHVESAAVAVAAAVAAAAVGRRWRVRGVRSLGVEAHFFAILKTGMRVRSKTMFVWRCGRDGNENREPEQ